MMPIPIAQYLGRIVQPSPLPGMAALHVDRAVTDANAVADAEAAVERDCEAAYQRGLHEGEAKGAAVLEQMLASERRTSDARLVDARAAWAEQTGADLGQRVREIFEGLEHRVADQAGRVLGPFLEARILDRALRELRDALSSLLTAADPPAVRISGPADLLEALREAASGALDAAEFIAAETVDIEIVADDTTIESQLHAWMQRLREAIA